MWLTPTKGLFVANATPSMSCKVAPAAASASLTTPLIFSRCSREASSGTTPPYFSCVAICEAMTFEWTLTPSSMTAAAVSSHELSIPRISIGPHHDIRHISYEIWRMPYDGGVFLVLWIKIRPDDIGTQDQPLGARGTRG